MSAGHVHPIFDALFGDLSAVGLLPKPVTEQPSRSAQEIREALDALGVPSARDALDAANPQRKPR